MLELNVIKRLIGCAVFAAVTTSMSAQNGPYLPEASQPIARTMNDQRPSDVFEPNFSNMFAYSNVAETSASGSYYSSADLMNPAANIYTDWKNKGVKAAPGYAPTRTRIDLRGFHMPTPSRQVTSPFGQRWGRLHAGLDIKVYIGDTIRAAFDGKIRVVDFDARGYGKYVVIRHPNGLETLYGHMSKQLVKDNQIVRAGDPIGLGGNTGRSTGSHLHFETRICGVPVNPALMFDFPHQDVTGDYYYTTKTYGTRQ